MTGFSFSAATFEGQRVSLPAPVSCQLSLDEDSPAHAFSATFPVSAALPPLYSCDVSYQGSPVFSGLLDQQTISVSADGSLLKLAARSRAALLLENDALPQTYLNPSLQQLFDRHAAPYGFTEISGNLGPFRGKFTVRKGMSEWQALSEFAAYFLGVTLRPAGDRSLDASGKPSARSVTFSNSSGLPYSSLSHSFLLQNQASHLHLQPALGASYSGLVVDQAAVRLGVQRHRYLSLRPFLAQRSLEQSRRKAQEVTVLSPLPLFHRLSLGDLACLDDPVFAHTGELSVAKISFSLDDKGQRSCLTLRPVVKL